MINRGHFADFDDFENRTVGCSEFELVADRDRTMGLMGHLDLPVRVWMFAPHDLPVSRITRVFCCMRQIALDHTVAELSGNSVTEVRHFQNFA
ncbi:hypothetical protein MACH01_12840 [Thalassospira tepidiphila]|nr:hypothetical protein MACH01_12840 [Thalassospira tepidiphila]